MGKNIIVVFLISFFIIKTINHQKLAVLPEIRSHYDVSNAKAGVQKVLYGVGAQRILTAKKICQKNGKHEH